MFNTLSIFRNPNIEINLSGKTIEIKPPPFYRQKRVNDIAKETFLNTSFNCFSFGSYATLFTCVIAQGLITQKSWTKKDIKALAFLGTVINTYSFIWYQNASGNGIPFTNHLTPSEKNPKTPLLFAALGNTAMLYSLISNHLCSKASPTNFFKVRKFALISSLTTFSLIPLGILSFVAYTALDNYTPKSFKLKSPQEIKDITSNLNKSIESYRFFPSNSVDIFKYMDLDNRVKFIDQRILSMKESEKVDTDLSPHIQKDLRELMYLNERDFFEKISEDSKAFIFDRLKEYLISCMEAQNSEINDPKQWISSNLSGNESPLFGKIEYFVREGGLDSFKTEIFKDFESKVSIKNPKTP